MTAFDSRALRGISKMDVRCVVTGRTADGKSIFEGDSEVRPITLDLLPGAEFHRLGGSDEPVQLPSDGAQAPIPTYFPPLGGFRFGLFTVGPDSVALPPDLDIPAAVAEIQQKLPPAPPRATSSRPPERG